jgi:DNA processing protein
MIESTVSLEENSCLTASTYEDYTPWIALSRVNGLGGAGLKRLAAHFADPTAALSAPKAVLNEVPGLDKDMIEGLLSFSQWPQAKAELRRAQDEGVGLVPFIDPKYPARLRAIADPPPLLYVKGEIHPEDERAVAVVGSRSASDYGRRVARNISSGLALLGFTVVSGMARGVDGAAHEAALDSGGRTIAVLGCGVDRIYPPEHDGLYKRISRQGAVISELPLGTRPAAFNFPARNRLISGLSLGVVVAEATEKSGSLITAALALEQNREVFAVPGEVGSSRSRGAHRLIRQGAKLVESADDIIEEIAPQLARPQGASRPQRQLPQQCSDDTRRIFGLLQQRTLQIDEVIETSGLSSAQVSEILLELELLGFLRQLPGKRYAAEQ